MRKINETKIKAAMIKYKTLPKMRYCNLSDTEIIYTNGFSICKIKKSVLTERQLINSEEIDRDLLIKLYNVFENNVEKYSLLSYEGIEKTIKYGKKEIEVGCFKFSNGNKVYCNNVYYEILKDYNTKVYGIDNKHCLFMIAENGFKLGVMPIRVVKDD